MAKGVIQIEGEWVEFLFDWILHFVIKMHSANELIGTYLRFSKNSLVLRIQTSDFYSCPIQLLSEVRGVCLLVPFPFCCGFFRDFKMLIKRLLVSVAN